MSLSVDPIYGRDRAIVCVLRPSHHGYELLVFDHPSAGTQITKGRIEPSETPENAALREIAEESGLRFGRLTSLGTVRRVFTHPETGEEVSELWHCWTAQAAPEVADSWTHTAEDEQLVFDYRWIPLEESALGVVHPHFSEVVTLLLEHFR